MTRSMLEYSKLILQKVSFDQQLFIKEFKKAVTRLLDNEVKELELWVTQQFGLQYLPAVSRA